MVVKLQNSTLLLELNRGIVVDFFEAKQYESVSRKLPRRVELMVLYFFMVQIQLGDYFIFQFINLILVEFRNINFSLITNLTL